MDTLSGITPKDLLRILFKRQWVIIWFFLAVTTCAVVGASLFFTPSYHANSQILLVLGREHVADLPPTSDGKERTQVRFNQDEQVELAMQILQGRQLIERVVETLGPTVIYPQLGKAPDGLLDKLQGKKKLSAEETLEAATLAVQTNLVIDRAGKNSALINVGFVHPNPQMAAKVTNTLVAKYLDRHLDIHKNTQLSGFFEEQLKSQKLALNAAQTALKAFKDKHALSATFEAEQETLMTQQGAMQEAVNETQSRVAEIENRLSLLRGQTQPQAAKEAPVDEVKERMVKTLEEHLVQLEIKESELTGRYTPEAPVFAKVRGEIQSVRERLAQLNVGRIKAPAATKDTKESVYALAQRQILQNDAELKAAKARQQIQLAQLGELQQRLAKLENIENEYARLQQEVDRLQQSYRMYESKTEESRISTVMDTEKITSIKLIEPALPPPYPLKSKQMVAVILALGVGLVGGIGLAFLIELLSDRAERREDVERLLGLPVLAVIPELAELGYKPRVRTRAA
jgi:uncharacterized protein involved in exopolysaccharide biosynthesis